MASRFQISSLVPRGLVVEAVVEDESCLIVIAHALANLSFGSCGRGEF
jgi:hypothetical protein